MRNFLTACLLLFLLSGLSACLQLPGTKLSTQGNWILISIEPEGEGVRNPEIPINLSLNKDSTYEFMANNRYEGEYLKKGDHILFKPGSSTNKGRKEDEAVFIEIFFNAHHYRLRKRQMVLENKEKDMMLVFERE